MAYYRILCDGYPLLDTRLNDYNLISPKCTIELNKTGSLVFDIYPTHPYYDLIHKVSSVITFLEGEEIIFQGRVMDDDIDFDKIKTVECEGELSFLLDSIVRPYTYEGSVEGLVEQFIDSHNDQVETKKRFTVGQVTVTDPNDYIIRAASAYPTTWNEFNDKCIALLGGYMRLRYTEQVTYFDYIENYGNVNSQVIDFGSNLINLSKYVKGADVATRIIPLGAVIDNDGEAGEQKRLTIENINDGLDYVEDNEAIGVYGVITKVVTFDDVTTETVLLQRGFQALPEQKLLQITLEITALDLHLLNVDVERI
ncbi:MAG: phage tail protein, partial [Limosilactobacillus sp.]|nr:phage tail protein [Limosilactobacillus sp.]